jgi:drug/metabolite transporter (DMT)-like permease
MCIVGVTLPLSLSLSFGFLIFAIGNGGDAVGLTFTPQSVITPIGSVSLVSNLVFARLLLRETIGLPTLGGVLLIIGGTRGWARAPTRHATVRV